MLSSASSAAAPGDLDSGPGPQDSPGLPASKPEPQFSELIDRWLAEGDRLNEQAGAVEAPALPVSQLDRWRQRAIELGRTALERHRLEVLVAIGLLPLMLFLISQAGSHRAPVAPRPAPVAVARPAPGPALPPRAPAPAARPPAAAPVAPGLLSEGLLRQCTAGPAVRPAAPAHRAVVHRQNPAVHRPAQAPAPAKAPAHVAPPVARPADARLGKAAFHPPAPAATSPRPAGRGAEPAPPNRRFAR